MKTPKELNLNNPGCSEGRTKPREKNERSATPSAANVEKSDVLFSDGMECTLKMNSISN